MIDRIEELLGLLAAEEDEEEEEQKGTITLPGTEESGPAPSRDDGGKVGETGTGDKNAGRTAGEIASERPGLMAGETEDGGTEDGGTEDRGGGLRSERSESGEAPEGRTAFAQSEALRASGTRPALTGPKARPLGRAANSRSVTTGETDAESVPAVGELWKDGPVWTVQSVKPEAVRARGTAAAERAARAEDAVLPSRDAGLIWSGMERAARDGAAALALEDGRRFGAARAGLEQAGLEQAGLKGLYRQTVGGLRPAAPALPPEQVGRTARAQEPGSAAPPAVEELDRAVRRDSRRYDGGMSIY